MHHKRVVESEITLLATDRRAEAHHEGVSRGDCEGPRR
jgi:hypothetical protein